MASNRIVSYVVFSMFSRVCCGAVDETAKGPPAKKRRKGRIRHSSTSKFEIWSATH